MMKGEGSRSGETRDYPSLLPEGSLTSTSVPQPIRDDSALSPWQIIQRGLMGNVQGGIYLSDG